MKKQMFPIYLFGIYLLFFSGCMAMGVRGMEHHASREGRSMGRTVIRQLHTESAKINLEIPPLFAGERATVSVTLSAPQYGTSISDALVIFTTQRIDLSPSESKRTRVDDSIEHRAEKGMVPGIYLLNHTFEGEGVYEIAAQIWINDKEEAASPLVIREIQEVILTEKTGGRRNMISMGLVGGAGMVLMMIITMGGFLF